MKKYILFVTFAIISVQGLNQTVTEHLTPEATWHDGNDRDWCDKGFGTTFISWNGVIHVFNYQGNGLDAGGHAYMYTINAGNKTSQSDLNNVKMEDYKVGPSNDHNNKLVFGYSGEQNSKDEGPVLGQTFTFQFNGRAWYYEHIQNGYYFSGTCSSCNESYECFAQLPLDDSQKCYTYYTPNSPSSQIWKQGGFQLDSLMYFLVYRDDKKYWEIDEYSFSSSNSMFQSNNNTILFNPTVNLNTNHPIGLSSFTRIGGIITRLDSLGSPYFLVLFYTTTGMALGKIIPGVVNGKVTFTWEDALVYPNGYCCPVSSFSGGGFTLSDGSIKGNRTLSNVQNVDQSDRIIIYSEFTSANSDGNRNVYYWEFHFNNTAWTYDNDGQFLLPSSRAPHTVSDDANGNTDYHLYATYQLIPMDYSDMIKGDEGYQSYAWLIYPDKDRHFNGSMFLSDSWRQDPDLLVESYDLDDYQSYENIEDLWSLMGIIDGAPPVSIDWDTWYAGIHGFDFPTQLTFEVDTVGATGFSTDSENEWSIGQSIDISATSKKRKYTLNEKLKYSQTYENSAKQDSSSTETKTSPFKLDDENQNNGFFIYSAPNMKRYTYYTYPWWDNNTLDYPSQSSLQYLFQTISTSLVNYEVNLSKFPFNVNNPNDPTMSGWMYNSGRYLIDQQANLYGLQPAFQLDWTSGSSGTTDIVSSEIKDETSNKNNRTWEFDVEAGIGSTQKIPDICKIEKNLSVGAGYKTSLMSETTTTTSYGHKISASLEGLIEKNAGINTSGLHMLGYLFRPEDKPDWWYFDSLGGQKPFYLAWVVQSAPHSIKLQSPSNGSLLKNGDLFFTWMPDMGELHDYELLVSKSANICYPNAVYRKQVGKANALSAPDFHPEPGTTYYWAVQALDENGLRVYSRIWNFTLTKEESTEATPKGSLNALVYPNPGKGDEIRIAVDPGPVGKITVQLVDLNSTRLRVEDITTSPGSASMITFNDLNLAPGIYFVIIRSENEQTVKKVVVK